MKNFVFSFLPVFLLGVGLLVPGVLAQEDQQSNQKFPQESQSVDVSDDEIGHVAAVMAEVEVLRKKYRAQLAETKDPEKAKQIQREMAEAIDAAIQDNENLTPKRYQAIVQAAQTDTDLQESLIAALEKERARRAKQDG